MTIWEVCPNERPLLPVGSQLLRTNQRSDILFWNDDKSFVINILTFLTSQICRSIATRAAITASMSIKIWIFAKVFSYSSSCFFTSITKWYFCHARIEMFQFGTIGTILIFVGNGYLRGVAKNWRLDSIKSSNIYSEERRMN